MYIKGVRSFRFLTLGGALAGRQLPASDFPELQSGYPSWQVDARR